MQPANRLVVPRVSGLKLLDPLSRVSIKRIRPFVLAGTIRGRRVVHAVILAYETGLTQAGTA
jgi:hypothetical protein